MLKCLHAPAVYGMSNSKKKYNAKGSSNATGIDIFQRMQKDYMVNLQFEDVVYDVVDSERNTKVILNGVSGEFRSGELSAIMGPSGCGKTTLLNLLSGYRVPTTSGHMYVNNAPQSCKVLRKLSHYIMQDDSISPHFTVWETLMYASKFKLNASLSQKHCATVIFDVLEKLHLKKQMHVLISDLSGGERKRVSIAVELLDHPAVLLLDEPTTGLDEPCAFQCIAILMQLARSGCTVICSIHAPSARLLQMFDRVYVLAEGQCIYQGLAEDIVAYLKSFGLQCSLTHNPGDTIIEVATRAYGDFQNDMVKRCNNGKISQWLPDVGDAQTRLKFKMDGQLNSKFNFVEIHNTWWFEYVWILRRVLKQMWRDRSNVKLRISVQILVAALIAWAYVGIGNDATLAVYNYFFLLLCVLKFVHMCTLPLFAHVPLEMKYLRREYFNQWYRLSSYFMAYMTAQIPIVVAMSSVCSAILYLITGQPLELERFVLFVGIITMTSLVSVTFGICIGSRFSLLNSLFLGPNITAVWTVLANYAMVRPQPTTFERFLISSSYMRHSLEGLMAALFHFNRQTMECPPRDMFCIFSKPKYILKFTSCEDVNYLRSILYLLGFQLLFMSLAFVNFHNRLNSSGQRATNRQYRYVKHVLRKYFYFRVG